MRREMRRILSTESIGGNAGSYTDAQGHEIPCAAANFRADRKTGEILRFGNPHELPPEIRNNKDLETATFRLIMQSFPDGLPAYTIVDVYTDKLGREAARNLQNTAFGWNLERLGRNKGVPTA